MQLSIRSTGGFVTVQRFTAKSLTVRGLAMTAFRHPALRHRLATCPPATFCLPEQEWRLPPRSIVGYASSEYARVLALIWRRKGRSTYAGSLRSRPMSPSGHSRRNCRCSTRWRLRAAGGDEAESIRRLILPAARPKWMSFLPLTEIRQRRCWHAFGEARVKCRGGRFPGWFYAPHRRPDHYCASPFR